MPLSEGDQKGNTCAVCGGLLRMEWTLVFEQMRPHTMRLDPEIVSPQRLCPGHYPEQVTPHDGKLSKSVPSRVSFCEGYEVRGSLAEGIRIEGRHADGLHDDVVLMPDEALELLTWLLQHRSALEELVKEQGA